MTKEVKRKVKKDAFMAFRNGGVAMMNSLKLPWKASDDWDSMVKSADYALAHANKSGERGTAMANAATLAKANTPAPQEGDLLK